MMNRRIQELSEKARAYATTRHPISLIVLSVDPYLFEQKFAQLIVKECARISNEVDYTMTNQGAASAQAFMEHFGVKR